MPPGSPSEAPEDRWGVRGDCGESLETPLHELAFTVSGRGSKEPRDLSKAIWGRLAEQDTH